jgi:hypothetical protein
MRNSSEFEVYNNLRNFIIKQPLMTTDIIASIANISLALSLIVAVIFGISQGRAAARDRKERLTLETMRIFHTREFAELILHINTGRIPNTQKELYSLPRADQAKFVQFGQEMESLGLLVAEKLINIDLVDKTLGSFVTTSWQKYRPVFQNIREITPDPFLGEYFQWLAESIEERMKNNPREPFHLQNKKIE